MYGVQQVVRVERRVQEADDVPRLGDVPHGDGALAVHAPDGPGHPRAGYVYAYVYAYGYAYGYFF